MASNCAIVYVVFPVQRIFLSNQHLRLEGVKTSVSEFLSARIVYEFEAKAFYCAFCVA
jgi:hypothetical protein